ncbi:MAG TPA: hypothetical protein VNN22_24250 [Verrucomicrobiae bacterium]|nr:hypothetical protein [Verrucomicrobiae bacterium]
MLLAELSAYDPPVMIAGFCACLMFLFMGANAAMDFWRNIKDKPTGAEMMEKAREEFQPIGDYQPKGDYITRLEWNQRESKLERELKNLSDENKAILKAGAVREEHLASLIEALDSRIDELPKKMIDQLKATLDLFDKLKGKQP